MNHDEREQVIYTFITVAWRVANHFDDADSWAVVTEKLYAAKEYMLLTSDLGERFVLACFLYNIALLRRANCTKSLFSEETIDVDTMKQRLQNEEDAKHFALYQAKL